MSKTPTHDICLAEDWKDGEGADRTKFTNIGAAWLNEGGSITCTMREGLAVSGRFVIFPRSEKGEPQS